MIQRNGSGPFFSHLLGDDIDHAAHRIRTVQSGHRAANYFDAFDSGQWRHETGRGFIETVGGNVAGGILSTTIDQNQRVLARHPADTDVQTAGFTSALTYIDPLYITQRMCQAVVALLLQILLTDDTDACRRFGYLLLEARGSDDGIGEANRFVVRQGHAAGQQAQAADKGVVGKGRSVRQHRALLSEKLKTE